MSLECKPDNENRKFEYLNEVIDITIVVAAEEAIASEYKKNRSVSLWTRKLEVERKVRMLRKNINLCNTDRKEGRKTDIE